MARQSHTPTVAFGNFPSLALTANSADLAMTAANASDKEQVTASGNDLIIAHNTGAGARTVTITSVADPRNRRTGDITSYSIGAGEYAVFGPFRRDGWIQSDGKIYFEAEHSEVKFGVVALPQ